MSDLPSEDIFDKILDYGGLWALAVVVALGFLYKYGKEIIGLFGGCITHYREKGSRREQELKSINERIDKIADLVESISLGNAAHNHAQIEQLAALTEDVKKEVGSIGRIVQSISVSQPSGGKDHLSINVLSQLEVICHRVDQSVEKLEEAAESQDLALGARARLLQGICKDLFEAKQGIADLISTEAEE